MRYRSLGRDGTAVSALSLVIPEGPMGRGEAAELIYGALEQGVNCFEFSAGSDAATLKAACEALTVVERNLILVGLRLNHEASGRGLSLQTLQRALQIMLGECRLERLDLLSLEAPEPGDAVLPIFQAMDKLRDARRLRMLGVVGDGPALDPHIDSGRFDLISMPFTISSGWVERNRLRRAQERDMSIIGSHFMPTNLPPKQENSAARSIKKLVGKVEDPSRQVYDFLYRSPDWTAEQICLAYALTEPSLATIQIHGGKPDYVQAMATIPDREMPNGVPALIEMARFSAGPESKRA
jgi:aryl-alcohol dehydrogenase-like predicted oxidoreductase